MFVGMRIIDLALLDEIRYQVRRRHRQARV